MPLPPGIRVLIFDADLSSPTLLDDVTTLVSGLRITTAVHGGFKTCDFNLALSVGDSWAYLHEVLNTAQFGRKGRHFNRVVVSETIGGSDANVVWEGRIMTAELRIQPDFLGLAITALGYWSACRDQYYSASDGSRTNWASGGPHTVDDIIKEMLTEECPSISSDHTNIDANSRDVVGIVLTSRRYPMEIILSDLATVSDSDDSTWYFMVWEGRTPFWKKKTISNPKWLVWLAGERAGIQSLTLRQDATNMRNAITPVDSGTEGTTQTNASSLTQYPRRELLLTVPSGSNANTEIDAADRAADERGAPQQTQSFVVDGTVFEVPVSGALHESGKWRVRAGDVIRVQDLIPDTAPTAFLDGLRTFFITRTEYAFDTGILRIQPDTFSRSLVGLLPRLGTIERDR
jgi:hypothetical protein